MIAERAGQIKKSDDEVGLKVERTGWEVFVEDFTLGHGVGRFTEGGLRSRLCV